jgi:hypothetical protein
MRSSTLAARQLVGAAGALGERWHRPEVACRRRSHFSYGRREADERFGDDALVGSVAPSTSAAMQNEARIGGRELLPYA